MDSCLKDWLDIISKFILASGVVFAAINYRNQVRTRRAEWLESLFEKFYQREELKEIRRWIESGEIESKITRGTIPSENDEKFADYLNFFEFIATLEADKRINRRDVLNLFDFYLRKIKGSAKCMEWINDSEYGFENLRNLLNKL